MWISRLRSIVRWRVSYLRDHWWTDFRLGIESSGIQRRVAHGEASNLGEHYQFYEPTVPRLFNAMVATLPAGALSSHTFIDIGAGRGRGLVLAVEAGFREVIGVELDRSLSEVARHNISRYGSRRTVDAVIRVWEGDALDFSFPRGPVVLFLYNPFDGQAMTHFFQNFTESRVGIGPPSYVLYQNPVAIEQCLAFKKVHLLHEVDGNAVLVVE